MQQIRCKRFKVQNAAHAFQIRDFSSQMQENSKENCHRPENGNRARILWVKETDCSRFGKKKPCNHICFWGFPTQTQDKDRLTGRSFCWLPALPLCMDSSAHSSPKSIIGVLTRNLATKRWDGVFLMAYLRWVAPCYGVYVRWFLLGGWGGAASQSRRSAKAGLDA